LAIRDAASSRVIPFSEIDIRILASEKPRLSRWLIHFLHRRGQTAGILRIRSLERVIHLYPTSVPTTGRDDGVPRFSFFNPTITRSSTRAGGTQSGVGDSAIGPPRWLFVLSSTDFNRQRMLLGRRGFSRLVARILARALHAGKHPVLIGPPSIINVLSVLSNALSDAIELLPFCPFAEFETRLLDAEHAFFWDSFSFSVLLRVANALPVFVFDRGHLARAIKPFYQVALSTHFGGWVPPFLDLGARLEPHDLADLAEKQNLAMRVILDRWRSSPTPDELVDRLLR